VALSIVTVLLLSAAHNTWVISVRDAIGQATSWYHKRREALLGISAQEPPKDVKKQDAVDAAVDKQGDNAGRAVVTNIEWFQENLLQALKSADLGNFQQIGALWQAVKTDGVISGVLSTTTTGLVTLPKIYTTKSKDADGQRQIDALRDCFDAMLPTAELAKLVGDGRALGVGVGLFTRTAFAKHPVLVRLPPDFLKYDWEMGKWFYTFKFGELPVTPGDGLWVLHCPGGKFAPWQDGLIAALGNAWIPKVHAKAYRNNYESKFGNPARVATIPIGGTEPIKAKLLRDMLQWGADTVIGLTPGYDVKLLEASGQGYQVFKETIDNSDNEIIILITGQKVTTTGGVGFSNTGIHEAIAKDIIEWQAAALADTVNKQCIPQWVIDNFGASALNDYVKVCWNIQPPTDKKKEGDAIIALADGWDRLRKVLALYGRDIDIDAVLNATGIPTIKLADTSKTPDFMTSVTDTQYFVKVNEYRIRYKLPLLDKADGTLDPDGDITLAAYRLKLEAQSTLTATSADSQVNQLQSGDALPDLDGDGVPDEESDPTARQMRVENLNSLGVDHCLCKQHCRRCRYCGVELVELGEADENGEIQITRKWVEWTGGKE